MEIFATIIVTAQKATEARTVAATLPGGEGMLTAALSATGTEPATHYIASGYADSALIDALRDLCDVSDASPQDAMQDAGLQPCAPSSY